jgi:hypothetical protein
LRATGLHDANGIGDDPDGGDAWIGRVGELHPDRYTPRSMPSRLVSGACRATTRNVSLPLVTAAFATRPVVRAGCRAGRASRPSPSR